MIIISISFSVASVTLVERANQTIRRLIDKYCIQHHVSNMWKTIGRILDIYNNSYHTSIKDTPENVYENVRENISEKELLGFMKSFRNEDIVEKRMHKKSIPIPIVKVGDFVRIAKIKKNPLDKSSGINNYSDHVYEVVHEIKSRTIGRMNRFVLKDEDGNEVGNRFFADELLVIPKDKKYQK